VIVISGDEVRQPAEVIAAPFPSNNTKGLAVARSLSVYNGVLVRVTLRPVCQLLATLLQVDLARSERTEEMVRTYTILSNDLEVTLVYPVVVDSLEV
jgi:hypothetical protein